MSHCKSVVIRAVADDLDSFFASAKPSAAPSQATSYAPSPANMASPAASLGHPDSQQDSDFFGFGSFGSPAQHTGRSSAATAAPFQHQQASVDPFDLFAEGSTVPASAAAASVSGSQGAVADDGLFGDVEGRQGVSALLTCSLRCYILLSAWRQGVHPTVAAYAGIVVLLTFGCVMQQDCNCSKKGKARAFTPAMMHMLLGVASAPGQRLTVWQLAYQSAAS